tara:strand:+ start:317 stop:523 length:207 start_codon:yes stop_codon:yes gene_type:complete
MQVQYKELAVVEVQFNVEQQEELELVAEVLEEDPLVVLQLEQEQPTLVVEAEVLLLAHVLQELEVAES